MKKTIRSRGMSRFLAAICICSFLTAVMVMPNVKAAGNCPIYGEEHVFSQHYATGSGYPDAYSHTYTYYVYGGQGYSSSCTYTRYHQYYELQCPCGAHLNGVTHDHIYLEYHPGSVGQPNGCGSGWRNITLPSDF